MRQGLYMLVVLAAMSCGKGDDKSAILNEGPATELTGVWARHCLPSDATYDVTELVVGNPTILMNMSFYSDPGCKTLDYTATYHGSYSIGEPSGEGKALDLAPQAMEFTPVSANYVSYFNFLKLCGYSDWKANQTRACNDQAEALFTIFAIEDNALLTGKTTALKNGTSPSSRPTALDRDEVYYRE
ncbi:MAG: hypothetical protein AB7H97_16490 [Pseudobdellovibrionaceae bacterium]